MSLDYDATRVANFNELKHNDGRIKHEYVDIIFATMAVGMGEITEKNYLEFYLRMCVWDGMVGFNQRKLADVKRMIGLRTNVFPVEARSKWFKRIFEAQLMSLSYNERHKEEQDAEVQATS